MMKVISKELYYGYNSQRYEFNDVYAESISHKGLLMCYSLATSDAAQLISLELRAKHEEIGVAEKWHKLFSHETFVVLFDNLERFLHAYDDNDFGTWRLVINYQNVEIGISGNRESSEIGLSYPGDKKINLLPLLSSAETKTYEYNNYDKEVIGMLKSNFGMSVKRAVLAVQKLQTHPEIYDEFVLAVTSGKYVNGFGAVAVEGFTAETLSTNYPLSLLGAYNYLIYLRESPKEALEDLRKGLPRK